MKIADLFVDLNLDTSKFDRQLNATLARAAARDIRVGVTVDSRTADRSLRGLDSNIRKATQGINTFTGRVSLMADALLAVAPAAVGISAVAVPAFTALAQAAVGAGVGAGTAMLAFQGLGDALKAMQKASLDPTVENLEALREEMLQLSPAARDFARYVFGLSGEFQRLKASAGSGLFPGLQAGLDAASTRLPQVNNLLLQYGGTLGDITARSGQALATERWDVLFGVIADGRPMLDSLADSTGNVAHGILEIVDAFEPLSSDGFDWLSDATRAFDAWATSLDQTEGFKEFSEYVRQTGPEIAETLGAVAMAVVDIGVATAPLAGPVLNTIEALAEVLSTIANSPIGPALLGGALAMRVFARSAQVAAPAMTALNTAILDFRTTGPATGGALGALGRSVKGLAGPAGFVGLAASASSTNDAVSTLGTAASGAAIGFSVGGPWGAAIGGAAGLLAGLALQTDEAAESTENLSKALASAGQTATAESWNVAAAAALKQKDNLDQLGISTEVYTRALMGEKNASDIVNDAISSLESTQAQQIATTKQYGGASAESAASMFAQDEAAASLSDELGSVSNAQKDAADTADLSASAQQSQAEALGLVDTAAERAADAIAAFKRQVSSLNEFLKKRATIRDYEASLDDLAANLKKGAKNWDVNTERGRENQQMLDDVVGSALAVADTLKGEARTNFLKGVRADLVNVKQEFPAATAEVNKLLDEVKALQKVDPDVVITTNAEQINGDIAALKAQIAGLSGKTITIQTNYINKRIGMVAAGVGRAGGGEIHGPGTATSDSIPAMLSDGEFVMKAAAVRKYGVGFMHRANQLRLAAGGLVGKGAKQRAQNRAEYLFEQKLDALMEQAANGNTNALDRAIDLLKKAQGKVKKWSDEYVALQQQIDDALDLKRDERRNRRQNRREYRFDERMEDLADAASDGDLSAFDKQIALLKKKIKKVKKWSDEYRAFKEAIDDLMDAKKEARQAMRQERRENRDEYMFDALFDTLDTDGQLAMLRARQAKYAKWSDEWVTIQRQIDDIIKDAAQEAADAAREAAEEAARIAEQIKTARENLFMTLNGDFFNEGVVARLTAGADFRGVIGGIVEQARALYEAGGITQAAFFGITEIAKKYSLALEGVQEQLDANRKAQEEANDALDLAKDKLATAKQAYDSLKDSVKGSVTALGNFADASKGSAAAASKDVYEATLAKYGPGSANTAEAKRRMDATAIKPGAIVADLQSKIGKIRAFAGNIQTLRNLGLHPDAIRQILAMGPIDGAIYAEALATALPDEIHAINAATSELGTIGEGFGSLMADSFEGANVTMAQAGVDVAQKFLDGLKSEEQALIDYMKVLGQEMVDAIVSVIGSGAMAQAIQLAVGGTIPLPSASTVPDTLGSAAPITGQSTRLDQVTPRDLTLAEKNGNGVRIGAVYVQDNATAQVLVQRLGYWARQNGRTR